MLDNRTTVLVKEQQISLELSYDDKIIFVYWKKSISNCFEVTRYDECKPI